MKKLLISLTALLLLITAGCKSVPQKHEITLPPKPRRETRPEVNTVKDFGEVINYYEYLIQLWELWGEDVEKAIGESDE